MVIAFRDHLREQLKDPAFRRAWEESEPSYQFERDLIKIGISGVSETYREKQCPKCYAYLDFYGCCPVCDYGRCVICAPQSARGRGKHDNRRGRAYLRHQRQRIITKRQDIVKRIQGDAGRYYFLVGDGCFGSPRFFDVVGYGSYWSQSVYKRKPGRLAKYNLSCNCWLCKYEKRGGVLKPKYRHWYSFDQPITLGTVLV